MAARFQRQSPCEQTPASSRTRGRNAVTRAVRLPATALVLLAWLVRIAVPLRLYELLNFAC